MALVQTNLPLADILIEAGIGIWTMNTVLADNNVGATSANVAIKFCASLQEGFNYSNHSGSAGASFSFWFIGGGASGWYQSTELHLYRRYAEYMSITVDVHFEVLPTV
ncbi:hypothetical protein ES707_21323 [subsurface metagenome]